MRQILVKLKWFSGNSIFYSCQTRGFYGKWFLETVFSQFKRSLSMDFVFTCFEADQLHCFVNFVFLFLHCSTISGFLFLLMPGARDTIPFQTQARSGPPPKKKKNQVGTISLVNGDGNHWLMKILGSWNKFLLTKLDKWYVKFHGTRRNT